MSVLRKRDSAVGASAGGLTPVADSLSKRFPALWEMLSAEEWPDGSKRVGSTVLFFCDAGTVKACLNDRAQSLCCWVSGSGLEACLEALEKGLAADSLDWRAPAGGGTRRVKKSY